jgi:hypothetical protein
MKTMKMTTTKKMTMPPLHACRVYWAELYRYWIPRLRWVRSPRHRASAFRVLLLWEAASAQPLLPLCGGERPNERGSRGQRSRFRPTRTAPARSKFRTLRTHSRVQARGVQKLPKGWQEQRQGSTEEVYREVWQRGLHSCKPPSIHNLDFDQISGFQL